MSGKVTRVQRALARGQYLYPSCARLAIVCQLPADQIGVAIEDALVSGVDIFPGAFLGAALDRVFPEAPSEPAEDQE